MRATLPERPGALAALAAECGAAGVNILGVQVFPGVEAVTDELVLSTPDSWDEADLTGLVGRAGGLSVSAATCTEAALTDQPTRYVQAARGVLEAPSSFPEVVAALFDADVVPSGSAQDVMEMAVGDVQVQIRRSAPFTATEHARGAAMADLVSDVLAREHHPSPRLSDHRRMGEGSLPDYHVEGRSAVATIEGTRVGVATLLAAEPDLPDVLPVDLEVDAAWQRRGIGTRLLGDAARLANGLGAEAILLTTRSDNQAVMPMVMAAGMRGRIRMAGEVLTVRITVRDLRPLAVTRP
ncbi:GNAT family N-acetyltransferase [Nocardioides sp. cx-173]|uniref:GNAT family N-acetyltransferase n=1 Tax=Nocardioides sp. cx-173 TaxID=2898796 RepID=UPI001E3202A6|nr:GNAT family N-acetyltransferase [Nocardioides sp. cx-173]MCD4524645.1 GNAT family N-acetyltransferase [Nocardioides sp. cx-173]UGB42874.1 GNAT family N-acetyltransferase [Nocardioides sp. cx-173]